MTTEETPETPIPVKPDLRYIDAIDAICKFAEHFELNVNTPTMDFLKWRYNVLFLEEIEELQVAIGNEDVAGILDECMDVAFLAISQAYDLLRAKGFTPIQATVRTRQAMLQVCDANLRKNIPLKAGAKVTKPGDWKAPNFENILAPVRKAEPEPVFEVDMKHLPENVDA